MTEAPADLAAGAPDPLLPPAAMHPWKYDGARILIVDDDPASVVLLERVLAAAGYRHLKGTTNPRDVAMLCDVFRPDLLVLDLRMPGLSGLEVLARLQPTLEAEGYLPVLVVSADLSRESRAKALEGGARDFLHKPIDRTEVLLRIRNLLETRFLYQELARQNETLEERVRQRTRELIASRRDVLERLVRMAEARDDVTGQHTRRVGQLSALIADAMRLPTERVDVLRQAAPLHDIGKVGIADSILLKPGKLTTDEFETMKSHTIIGGQILAGADSEMMAVAERIAVGHHECWNGFGYPYGVRGEAIPLDARIVAVADFFDALSHDRPYRSAWPQAQVLHEIERGAGTRFDPTVVHAFQRLLPDAGDARETLFGPLHATV